MRNRLLATALCVLAVTLCTTRAEAQNNTNIGELGVVFWNPDPELTLQSGSLTGATGITDIDFVQEFGIEKKTFPEVRLTVGRSHKFRFAYVPVKYEADATIQRTITFRGQTFVVGVPASTEIKWNILKVGYEWDFVSMDRGYFGVVGELKYNKLEASIGSPALTSPAATDQDAPVPTIGVAGRGYVHPLVAISGEVGGLKISSDDFEAKFVDFDINGSVTFGRYIGVQGGYRAVTVDYVIEDDSGDLQLKGPYFGVVVRF
ncbi:MAG: hypothetical protein HY657_05650 [Acidobacteria bacterium]|nr:hypothetical protein [Acidobacteriota bacterium]